MSASRKAPASSAMKRKSRRSIVRGYELAPKMISRRPPYATARKYVPETEPFAPCDRWPPASTCSPSAVAPGRSRANIIRWLADVPECGCTLAQCARSMAIRPTGSTTSHSVSKRTREYSSVVVVSSAVPSHASTAGSAMLSAWACRRCARVISSYGSGSPVCRRSTPAGASRRRGRAPPVRLQPACSSPIHSHRCHHIPFFVSKRK